MSNKPSSKFDFNAAARKAVKDHPELKNRLIFIDAAQDNFAWVEHELLRMDADDEDIELLEKTVKEAQRRKTSFHQPIGKVGKKDMSALVFHADRYSVFGPEAGPVDQYATFDHETAHALTQNLNGTLAENTADAYAALRHLQRGEKPEDLSFAGWRRAAVMMLTGKTSHLTTMTLEKIVCDAKTADFMTLTPQETLAVARDYAKKFTPTQKQQAKLQNAFKGVGKMLPEQAFSKIAKVTLKADEDSRTFYVGARVLKAALDNEVGLTGTRLRLRGKAWDSIRRKLDDKLSKLPSRHPLRCSAL